MDLITVAISIALVVTGLACIAQSMRAAAEPKGIRISVLLLGVTALIMAILNLVDARNTPGTGAYSVLHWITWLVFVAAGVSIPLSRIRNREKRGQVSS
jgi:uncharacterized membrane protein HdeD (DUF308 family)